MTTPGSAALAPLTAYETWISAQGADASALPAKHRKMARDAHAFLRGSYPWWRGRPLPDRLGGNLVPVVRAVGDLHMENFGSWRDHEGRLVYGINDFDEVERLPISADLLRLATSALLAEELDHLKPDVLTDALLTGYRAGLAAPRPIFPDDADIWMRPYVLPSEKLRRKFWDEITALPTAVPPPAVQTTLRAALSPGATVTRFASRTAGLGSYALPRFVVLAEDSGGPVIREAKLLRPLRQMRGDPPAAIAADWKAVARGRNRSPDPWMELAAGWVVRRLSPGNRKIDLTGVMADVGAAQILTAMGAELAAVHSGDVDADTAAIARALEAAPKSWLTDAALAAAGDVRTAFKAFIAAQR